MGKFGLYVIALLIMVSCITRDDEMGERDNPCDPGGTSWTVNAVPQIDVRIDSGWAEFNHSTVTGAIELHLHIYDNNAPYDTLRATAVIAAMGIRRVVSVSDSTLPITGLTPGAAYSCTLLVTDIKGDTGICAVTHTAPIYLPVAGPQPKINSIDRKVIITWPPVSGAEEYRVYKSDAPDGAFNLIAQLTQPSEGDAIFSDSLEGYIPYYYLVSCVNSFSETFASDTLFGRRFCTSVTAPDIRSISKGTYQNYIELTIHRSTTEPAQIEIYRSLEDTLSFKIVDSFTQSGNYTFVCHDTVATTRNYYYRVAVINNIGWSSRWSDPVYGFISRLSAPGTFTASPSTDHIALSWESVSGTEYYRIYRSLSSCGDVMEVFDSTDTCHYNDTVTNSDMYAYRISGVNGAGFEGSRSVCRQARVILLSAPSSFTVTTGTYVRCIRLSWNSVDGADGYIIYRSGTSEYLLPIDTVTDDASYCDTTSDTSSFFYAVSAYNRSGTGIRSSTVRGYISQPPVLSVTSLPQAVELYWSPSNALMYYIYRSSPDSSSFICIDSTNNTHYFDSVPDYNVYYYRITRRTTDGMTVPGNIIASGRELSAPSGLLLTSMDDGVQLSWNRVPQAEQYQIYRSTSSTGMDVYTLVNDTLFFDAVSSDSSYWYSVAVLIGTRISRATTPVEGNPIGPPSAPTNIQVQGNNDGITITWLLPSTSSDASGYYIYRSRVSAGPFALIDSVATQNYVDAVTDTGYFFYRIAGYNSKGPGPRSAVYAGRLPVTVQPPQNGPSTPSMISATKGSETDRIMITWETSTGAEGYYVYRSPYSTAENFATGVVQAGHVTATAFYDSVTTDSMYFYRVKAYNTVMTGSYTDTIACGFRKPAAVPEKPSGLVTTTGSGITLNWESPPTTVGYIGYRIYRSETMSPDSSNILMSMNPTIHDVPPKTYPTIYYYRVTAYNQRGESGATEWVSGYRE